MENTKLIHLEKPNTLSKYLSKEERDKIVSLKITGFIGRKDFDDVLDGMCYLWGEYDDDDNFVPDYEHSANIRHLDLGDAIYVDGEFLPYFGFNAQLETFILPKGIKSTFDETEMETGISESENLRTLVLPENLKIVGGFHSCPNLTGLTLPEGLEEIVDNAFCGCEAITEIRIPASVRMLTGFAFAGCNLAAYEVDEANPYFTVIDGVIYSKDLKTLVAFPSAYPSREYTVLETTQIIGERAFSFSHVENVELPKGLNSIGYGAFSCSDIRKIEIPDSVIKIEDYAFDCCFDLEYICLPDNSMKNKIGKIELCPKLKFSIAKK